MIADVRGVGNPFGNPPSEGKGDTERVCKVRRRGKSDFDNARQPSPRLSSKWQ